nr:hypothetical protein [Tanacetum cinerariifolium]
MLNKDNYVPWSSRIIRYARSRLNSKMIVDSIENEPYVRRMIATPGEPDLPVLVPESFHEQTDEELTENDIKRMDADDQAIQTIILGLPKDVYVAVDSYETAKEIWELRQTKNLHETDFTQIYDFLKMSQDEVNKLRAERLAKTHDPLALMAHSQNSYKFLATHNDQSSSSTHSQQSFLINNKYNPQPSLNQNFMQPPMTSLEYINDLTEEINAALILFAKAFQLTAPTNNNQRTSSNPRNCQIAHPVMNMSQDRQIQNVRGNGGNQFGQYVGQVAQNQQGYNTWQKGIANQNGTGNVIAARAEGTGSGNQARCYNCRGLGHIARNYTARPRRRDPVYLQTQLLIAQKEEARIQLQAKEFNFMVAADGSAEVHLNDNSYDNEIFNMFTQDEQYTDLLEPILEPQLVLQNDNHVTYVAPSMVQSGGTVETSSAPNEETRAHQETIYRNLVDQVAQKMALGYPNPSYLKKPQLKQQSLYNGNLLLEEHDPPDVYVLEETLKLAQESREKMIFLKKKIKPANYAKINHLSRVFIPQSTKSKEELFSSNVSNMVTISKTISIPNEDLSDDTTPSVARKFLNEVKSSLVTLQPKFVQDFKSLAKEADESLDKQKSLELKIERLLKASVSHDIMSIVQNGFVNVPSDLQTELDRTKEKLEPQLRDLKGKSSDTLSASNTLDPLNQKLESKIIELEFQMVNYKREISHLKTTYKNLFDFITSNQAHAKLHNLIHENAQLRAWVFENTSEFMNNTSGMSVTPHVDKPKLSAVNPHSKKLHASISSHSIPQPREFNVVKHRNVIAPGMFKINPSQTFRVDLVPNKQSSASIRTNPITNSQRHVTFKENVSSDTVTASSTGLVHTARTRKPQPKSNTRSARVPSVSKSTDVKKNITVEDHRRTLLLSKNQKTMSSECNNIKLAIRNDKSKIVCDNLCVNVPSSTNQKRHKTQV